MSNFPLLEVVGRGSEAQLQVGEFIFYFSAFLVTSTTDHELYPDIKFIL